MTQSPDATRPLFEYLAESHQPPARADAVIGFGHFDLRIADRCADLWRSGEAGRIIFTGGIGAGTADLGRPEAEAFLARLREAHPDVPPEIVAVEPASTNTAENIRFTRALLASMPAPWHLGTGIQTALLVASPARMRRVRLTWAKLASDVIAFSAPVESSFETERALHESIGIPFAPFLFGELGRIVSYAAKDWIAREPVPSDLLAAADLLSGQP